MAVVLAALGLDWLLLCINCLVSNGHTHEPLTKAGVFLTIAFRRKTKANSVASGSANLAKLRKFCAKRWGETQWFLKGCRINCKVPCRIGLPAHSIGMLRSLAYLFPCCPGVAAGRRTGVIGN